MCDREGSQSRGGGGGRSATHLLVPFCDVLVYGGEIQVHFSERIEDGRAIGGILSRMAGWHGGESAIAELAGSRRNGATNEFTANTGVEFLDGTSVCTRGHGAVGSSVGSAIKGIDRLRKAELRRGHGYVRGGNERVSCASTRGEQRRVKASRRTTHGI